MFRISALLEAADNEFSAVRKAIDDLRARYSADIGKGELRIGLNTESVRTFIGKSETAQKIIEIAQDAGVRLSPVPEGDRPYQSLISVANSLGIETLDHLDGELGKALPKAREFFELVVKKRFEREAIPRTPQLFAAAMLRFVLMLVAPRDIFRALVSEASFAPDYAEALREIGPESKPRRKKVE